MLHALARLEAAVALLSRGAAVLGGVVALVCLGLVCASVAWRYFLGKPQPWIDHVAAWSVVALVMLAAAETQRRDEHIGVEVLRNRLKGKAFRAVRLLSVASVLAVASILLLEGIETVSFSRMIGIATDVEGVPKWWLHLAIPVGAGLLLIVAAVQVLVLAAGGEPRGPKPPDRAGETRRH